MKSSDVRDYMNELLAIAETQENRITKEISDTYLGTTLEVLIEDVNPKHEGSVCGRTEGNKLVFWRGDPAAKGNFVRVGITGAEPFALQGEPQSD